MVWSNQLGKFLNHLEVRCLGLLIEDNFTGCRWLNQIPCKLCALFALDSELLELGSELINANFSILVVLSIPKDERSHLSGLQLLLLQQEFEECDSLSELLWLDLFHSLGVNV